MTDPLELFEPASVQYDDMTGTAALDFEMDGRRRLLELAGVNPDEWSVCAVELYGGERLTGGSILAVSRALVAQYEDWHRVAAERDGRVPVTRFALPSERTDTLVGAFKRWSVHAMAKGIGELGIQLEIEDNRVAFEE